MKTKLDIKMGDLMFSVDIDGRVEQPQAVTPTVLDEVRLEASRQFRGPGSRLTVAQHRYWSAVGSVNDEHKRFASGRAR